MIGLGNVSLTAGPKVSDVCVYSQVSPCPTGPLSAACRLTVKDLALSKAARGFDILGHQLAALCLSVQLLPAVWF